MVKLIKEKIEILNILVLYLKQCLLNFFILILLLSFIKLK